jgi:hypothetical protein
MLRSPLTVLVVIATAVAIRSITVADDVPKFYPPGLQFDVTLLGGDTEAGCAPSLESR